MMQVLGRSSRYGVAVLLVAVAVVGFLAGQSRASGPEPLREAANAAVTVRYSPAPGWRPVADAPQIAGLSLTQPLAFAPGEDPAVVGLIAGELADVGSLPLPHAFLARLGTPPRGEAVELPGVPAYRYERLATISPARRLTVYAIPSSTSPETVTACYAATGGSSSLSACESIAVSMTFSGSASERSAYGELAPNGGYAHQISAGLGRVEALRSAAATRLRAGVPPTGLAGGASRLAGGLTRVTESLHAVQPPPAAESADAALLRALGSLRDAYQALALAAGGRAQAGYAAARPQLASVERQVDVAMSDFGLLGYERLVVEPSAQAAAQPRLHYGA